VLCSGPESRGHRAQTQLLNLARSSSQPLTNRQREILTPPNTEQNGYDAPIFRGDRGAIQLPVARHGARSSLESQRKAYIKRSYTRFARSRFFPGSDATAIELPVFLALSLCPDLIELERAKRCACPDPFVAPRWHHYVRVCDGNSNDRLTNAGMVISSSSMTTGALTRSEMVIHDERLVGKVKNF